MWQIAQNYRRVRPDLARQRLQEIIDRFPDTTFADSAKKALAEISPATQPTT
jgi:outer membrane protein assembly factor BamD (BamD/ComL family)